MCKLCNDTGTVCNVLALGIVQIVPCPNKHKTSDANHHDELEKFREDWNEKAN